MSYNLLNEVIKIATIRGSTDDDDDVDDDDSVETTTTTDKRTNAQRMGMDKKERNDETQTNHILVYHRVCGLSFGHGAMRGSSSD